MRVTGAFIWVFQTKVYSHAAHRRKVGWVLAAPLHRLELMAYSVLKKMEPQGGTSVTQRFCQRADGHTVETGQEVQGKE